jgi:general secretion pathway protein A
MYESFYGLTTPPFEVTPNPKYLLLTPAHNEALHMLEYGVRERKGIILLVGDAGTGKTTLLRKALSMTAPGAGAAARHCVYITNPRLEPAELFEHLAIGFNLPDVPSTSKPTLLRHLEQRLLQLHADGDRVALIVDEAQALSDDLIEELRLLANIESDDTKLLPLVLAGQPELSDRLNDHRLRHFKQRIALRCQLLPFTLNETAAFVFGRVRLAGGDATKLFTRDAVIAVHNASGGIPRTINVVCDNALLTGFALQRRPVDAAVVEEVRREFHLTAATQPANAEPAAAGADNEQPRTDGKSPTATSTSREQVRLGPMLVPAAGQRSVR